MIKNGREACSAARARKSSASVSRGPGFIGRRARGGAGEVDRGAVLVGVALRVDEEAPVVDEGSRDGANGDDGARVVDDVAVNPAVGVGDVEEANRDVIPERHRFSGAEHGPDGVFAGEDEIAFGHRSCRHQRCHPARHSGFAAGAEGGSAEEVLVGGEAPLEAELDGREAGAALAVEGEEPVLEHDVLEGVEADRGDVEGLPRVEEVVPEGAGLIVGTRR